LSEIKPFEGSVLEVAIAKQMLELPPDAVTLAIDYKDGDKISAAILGKIDKHWAFYIDIAKPFNSSLEGHAAIQFGW